MTDQLTHIDPDLLLRVAAGEEIAFRQLAKTYFNRLGTFIQHMTGSWPLTEEIVQDVLVKVWLNREQLPAVMRFDSWIFVIARNHTYDSLNRIAREKHRRQKWEREVLSGLHTEEGVAAQPALDRYNNLLEEAIGQLPPQQRKIYLLSRRQGMSSAAIVEETGLSVDTIKKHRSLAIKNIKAYLHRFLLFFSF